jgi:hypothetical protein
MFSLLKAHKTLDLRRRLIHLRATKEGLDLRWKIVANMVLEMRNRARANPRVQPYPTPSGRPTYLRGNGITNFVHFLYLNLMFIY